jgi:hypothetical protein
VRDESFVDLNTGVVLQGHEDTAGLRPPACMERSKRTTATIISIRSDIRQGNWQITDIDDPVGAQEMVPHVKQCCNLL